MKVAIRNDCSRFDHFGCKLVMRQYRALCAEYGMEIVKEGEQDLLIVNGEGTLHGGRSNASKLLDVEGPAVLMNTVYHRNPDSWGEKLKKFDFIAVRESFSRVELAKVGIEAVVVPDICFTWKPTVEWEGGQGLVGVQSITGIRPQGIPLVPVTGKAEDFFGELAKYDFCVTGRFHGIVAAAMLGMPFSAFPSNSCKNHGLMVDMGIGSRFSNIPKWHWKGQPTPASVQHYVSRASDRVRALFERMKHG